MGSRLREHARALAEGLALASESSSTSGTLRRVDVDDDGICVTLGLFRDDTDISVVLMFEVRPLGPRALSPTDATRHKISTQLAPRSGFRAFFTRTRAPHLAAPRAISIALVEPPASSADAHSVSPDRFARSRSIHPSVARSPPDSVDSN
jgi:hypothetical protein